MRDLRHSIKLLAARTPAPLRRFVKRFFVPEAYIHWLYAEQAKRAAQKKPAPDRTAQKIPQATPATSPSPAKRLEKGINAGFGKATAELLERYKVNRNPALVADAAWGLALWHSSVGEYGKALDHLTIRRLAEPRSRPDSLDYVLEIDALLKLGRVDDAERVLQSGIGSVGAIVPLCCLAANATALRTDVSQSEKDRLRLDWLNKPFMSSGLSALEIRDGTRPLAFDNLTAAPTSPRSGSSDAKVNVLMPAYNAAGTLAVAIESVLNQTWSNLELIIVDDGSSDGTWTIMQSYAARDPRVVVLRHEQNRGAYAARNTALRRSTGDFVTVNDADDWSHPERIALQVVDLLHSDHALNTTRMVRVLADLQIYVRPDGGMLTQCWSSLMTAREVLVAVGGWDECRVGADDELYRRLLARFGGNTRILCDGAPLCLASTRAESLTSLGDVGVCSLHYGARREYVEAFEYWHRIESMKPEPGWVVKPDSRSFPTPHICRSAAAQKLNYDVLLVSDFSMPGGTTADNVNMLQAAADMDFRCACWHWPRLGNAGSSNNPKIRRLLHEGVAESVVPGERVRCPLVIVHHPPILNAIPDRLLAVETDHCVIVVNQTPMTRTVGGQVAFQVEQVIGNARKVFGVEPALAPISPVVRRVLQEVRDVRLTPVDWTPLINIAAFRRVRSANDKARFPIVGRHGRDSEDKWPADAEALRQAYCAGTPCQVRLLGGAAWAQRILKTMPTNWTVLPFDSIDQADFLASLDSFVNYHHEHAIEAFGRAPLEAIAAGVPTILPATFSDIFGEAAIYAEPAHVFGVIKSLWADREAYEAQVTRGLNFVAANYGIERFADRVRPYLSPTQDHAPMPSNRPYQYNGSVCARAPSSFDAEAYWENRHREYRESLKSVGHIGLTEADNLANYEIKIRHVAAALEQALGSLDGKAILDAGCGIGLLSREIVLRGGRAVGVDLSKTALARSKAYAPEAQFECHPLDLMPYESTFDGAVSMDVLFHVVDDARWKASILRLIRAVKPGGVVVIQEAFEKGEARHPHLRWRTLEDYRQVLAETGGRIRAVETYISPREGAEKTLLIVETANEASQPGVSEDGTRPECRPS